MKKFFAFPFIALFLLAAFPGCSYKFNDVSVPPDIKTVYVDFIVNRAPIVNPQLSPNLTQRLKQKIVSQTRLNQMNSSEGADYFITGNIVRYDVITAGVSNNTGSGRPQSSVNRLTVSVRITLNDQKRGTTKDHDISRSFDFNANQSLQTAEIALMDEMVRNLSDEIFNRIFSDW